MTSKSEMNISVGAQSRSCHFRNTRHRAFVVTVFLQVADNH